MYLWQLYTAVVLTVALVLGGAHFAARQIEQRNAASAAREDCLIASPTPNPTAEYCAGRLRLLAGAR